MRFRKVVITGGAGFLGSHLVERFLSDGADVTVVDSLDTGFRSNIEAGFTTGRLRFVQADVIDPAWTADLEADLVMNLACAASPQRYQAKPIHTMQTCVLGALNAARLAQTHGARIVQASTSEVYGDPEVHPQTEEYRGAVNPVGPRACYEEGKRAAETLLFDLNRHAGLNIGVARIFNTYGPRMDPYDGRVVSNFIRQALTGKPITIYGDGRQTRSFCYVEDLVDGLWRLAHATADVPGPVNLGMPDEVTILDLAERIRDLVGTRTELRFEDAPIDDPKRRCPDIARAQDQLGWQPRTRLAEGLARTTAYFDNVISSGQIRAYTPAPPAPVPVADPVSEP